MKLKLAIILLFISCLNFAQSVIGGINSSAISSNNYMQAVGEIYVLPSNPNQENSGLLGVLYRVELLGIDEIENIQNELSVYPNPTANSIYFNTKSTTPLVEAEVFDLNGKLVLSEKIIDLKLDLTSLNKGVYFIKFPNSTIKAIKVIKK